MRLQNVLFAFPVLFSAISLADTRPNTPAERTHEETVALLKVAKHVRCSMVERADTRTADGLNVLQNPAPTKKVFFNSLKSEASSDSDFASFSLSWENKDYSFYYFMNSQIGEIRVFDKKRSQKSEVSLDLSDFAKPEPYLAHLRLENREIILVPHPQDNTLLVPALRVTELRASCQFLEGYVP